MMKNKMKPAGGKKKKGGMPDLTGDGKVTQADVLKGRGVFQAGGMAKKTKGYKAGGMMKTKGYKAGGMMKSKGYKAGGKVRGAGMCKRGVRPAKMVTMKGS